jgi:hypothetical protein
MLEVRWLCSQRNRLFEPAFASPLRLLDLSSNARGVDSNPSQILVPVDLREDRSPHCIRLRSQHDLRRHGQVSWRRSSPALSPLRSCSVGSCRHCRSRRRMLWSRMRRKSRMADKKRVLILCAGNSARSQMAEGEQALKYNRRDQG